MKKLKAALLVLGGLVVGIVIGGYLFSDTRPRSFLALNNCGGTCWQPNELVGLLTSVGIQKFPALVPSVVKETDKTIVVKHPAPNARIHYLVFPKTDIKNIAELSESDRDYLVDSFRVVGEIVREQKLVSYQLTTNGPGIQGVTYLHFHLTAR